MSEEQNYYKEESRKNWYSKSKLTIEEISLGCQMRMADSLETIAQDRVRLINENEKLKKDVQFWRDQYDKAWRINSAMKGWITRLKNKLSQ